MFIERTRFLSVGRQWSFESQSFVARYHKSLYLNFLGYVTGGPANSPQSVPARIGAIGFGFFTMIALTSYIHCQPRLAASLTSEQKHNCLHRCRWTLGYFPSRKYPPHGLSAFAICSAPLLSMSRRQNKWGTRATQQFSSHRNSFRHCSGGHSKACLHWARSCSHGLPLPSGR